MYISPIFFQKKFLRLCIIRDFMLTLRHANCFLPTLFVVHFDEVIRGKRRKQKGKGNGNG